MDSSSASGKHTETGIRLLYRLSQGIIRFFFSLFFGLKVEGAENVPLSGSFILASNHQSWCDPPIIGSVCPREICYAAKKELFETPILGTMIRYYNSIPVKRSGFDRTALVKLGEALGTGRGIIIFPEGKRFRDRKLHFPKAGVGMLAIRFNVKIVPTYIKGTARIRRQFLKRGIHVKFGRPVTLEDIGLSNANGKDGYRAVANKVMLQIAEVGGVEPPEGINP